MLAFMPSNTKKIIHETEKGLARRESNDSPQTKSPKTQGNKRNQLVMKGHEASESTLLAKESQRGLLSVQNHSWLVVDGGVLLLLTGRACSLVLDQEGPIVPVFFFFLQVISSSIFFPNSSSVYVCLPKD